MRSRANGWWQFWSIIEFAHFSSDLAAIHLHFCSTNYSPFYLSFPLNAFHKEFSSFSFFLEPRFVTHLFGLCFLVRFLASLFSHRLCLFVSFWSSLQSHGCNFRSFAFSMSAVVLTYHFMFFRYLIMISQHRLCRAQLNRNVTLTAVVFRSSTMRSRELNPRADLHSRPLGHLLRSTR